MNFPKHIIIHHSAVSRTLNDQQFKAIDRYHASKGWGKIGYHFLIESSGEVVTGRSESEVGAHCKERLMNYRSIGICLSGNFDIEDPTSDQMRMLIWLVDRLRTKYKIPVDNVVGHRAYAVDAKGRSYKSCPGIRFTDAMIRNAANHVLMKIDMVFARRFDGKILVAAEDKGRKWFVFDGKRYEIDKAPMFEQTIKGKAFTVWMTNESLEKIEIG